MPDLDIDLERVISDPAYRRAVLEYLKSEANKNEAPVAAVRTAEPAAAEDAPAK